MPISYVILQYFWRTSYSVRALNRVYPGYGKSTAGGEFAGYIMLIISSAMFLICAILALFAKNKNYEKIKTVCFIISSAYASLTAAVVFLLEKQFPAYEYIVHKL